jgi:hypothetical protein
LGWYFPCFYRGEGGGNFSDLGNDLGKKINPVTKIRDFDAHLGWEFWPVE